jgi:hypothetical protein
MRSWKSSLWAATVVLGAGLAVSEAASARIICSCFGDCWHTDARYNYNRDLHARYHPDDWFFHHHWIRTGIITGATTMKDTAIGVMGRGSHGDATAPKLLRTRRSRRGVYTRPGRNYPICETLCRRSSYQSLRTIRSAIFGCSRLARDRFA